MDKRPTMFKTIEEAQAEASFLTEEYTTATFCPLTRLNCNESCVCLMAAKTEEFGSIEKGKTTFGVKKPFCDNTMFSGERYEQNPA